MVLSSCLTFSLSSSQSRLCRLLHSTHYLILPLENLETALAETDLLLMTTSSLMDFGGGAPLNTLMSLMSCLSYRACQTKFLDFPQKAEGWNKNQNTDQGAGQNTALPLK